MTLNSGKIRLLLVEDHPITRAGLRMALEQEDKFDILAEAGDGEVAVKLALELVPDVVLMDMGLPRMSGIEASKAIKAQLPNCRVIIVTSHDLQEDVIAALLAKCEGFCLKDIDGAQLNMAICFVYAGGIWIDPSIAKKLIKVFVGQVPAGNAASSPSAGPAREVFTDRQLEVLSCAVDGLSNSEIAAKLTMNAQNIETHMSHIMEKLSASDSAQAAAKAQRDGSF